MMEIAAGAFKARCLKLMDEVQATREPIVVTKNGRPVVKLVPADEGPRDVFGCLEGTLEILGDVEAPVEPAESWAALR